MSTDTKVPAPWKVGEETVFVVGMEGPVTALDDDTITINDVTLPRRLDTGRGVRYLSVIWPEDAPCDRAHCDDDCDLDVTTPHTEELQDRIDVLERLVRSHHDDNHPGVIQFCTNRVCREVAS